MKTLPTANVARALLPVTGILASVFTFSVAVASPTSPLSFPFSQTTIRVLNNGEESTVGDFDGDGDIDIAASSEKLAWYANPGGESAHDPASWVETEIVPAETPGGAQQFSSLSAGDVNGDGRDDFVAHNRITNSLVYWSTADNGATWTQTPMIADLTNLGGIGATEIADIDGDDDLDVALISISDEVAWLENRERNGEGWVLDVIVSDFDNPNGVKVFDIDRDGDNDIVASSYWGGADWYENRNGDGSEWEDWHVGNIIPMGACGIGDVDGDGDIDFIAAQDEDDPNSGPEGVIWFENPDDPKNLVDGTTSWTKHTIDPALLQAADIHTADLDKDGDLDVVANGIDDCVIALWVNLDGRGNTWQRHLVSDDYEEPVSLHLGDVDGDGDLDVLTMNREGDDLDWWENPLAARDADFDPDRNVLVLGLGFQGPVATGDFDGDGDLDVVTGEDDDIDWVENLDGRGGAWTNHRLPNDVCFASDFSIVDMNQDGVMDIVVTTEDSLFGWLEPAKQELPWGIHRINDPGDAVAVDTGDIDRDGDVDIATVGDDTVTWWVNEDGAGDNWTRRVIDDGFGNGSDLVVVDVDRDGDLDFAVSTKAEPGEVFWLENRDGGATWIKHAVAAQELVASLDAGDIDLDGDIDFAVRLADGVGWIENVGGGQWDPDDFFDLLDGAAPTDEDVVLADVDGDGDLDALSADAVENQFFWVENPRKKPGAIWVPHVVAGELPGSAHVAAADFDGDGDLDFLGSGATSHVRWWENQSTPYRIAATGVSVQYPLVADPQVAIRFVARVGWTYHVERSLDFQVWEPVPGSETVARSRDAEIVVLKQGVRQFFRVVVSAR